MRYYEIIRITIIIYLEFNRTLEEGVLGSPRGPRDLEDHHVLKTSSGHRSACLRATGGDTSGVFAAVLFDWKTRISSFLWSLAPSEHYVPSSSPS